MDCLCVFEYRDGLGLSTHTHNINKVVLKAVLQRHRAPVQRRVKI